MNKQHKSDNARVVVFEEAAGYAVLLDKDSNMLEYFFNFFASEQVPGEAPKMITISVAAGKFGSREYFKINLVACKEETVKALAVYLDLNLNLYKNENQS